MTTVAISNEFLLAFSQVPKTKQKQVREFIEKFQENPSNPGANLEAIQSAKKAGLYSVRVNQDYRAVVFHPDGSPPLYLLLWVDTHDAAYEWARKRSVRVNPHTGALQVIPVVKATQEGPAVSAAPPPGRLFAGIRDKDLLRLGVPEDQIPLVRSFTRDEDLEEHSSDLPQEAYEALFLLAAGYSLAEVLRDLEKPEETTPVNPEDFTEALKHEDSQRRFVVVEDSSDLAKMLSAPLEQWRVFLHPKQRKLVEWRVNGPIRVLGGAGTGKTVVAMHRARFLAEKVFNSKNDRILVTTFTRNLAEDIQANLRQLCSSEALERIEVINIDRWAQHFLQRQGITVKLLFDKEADDLWGKALHLLPQGLDLSPQFFRNEWTQVIQAQGIQTKEQYLHASRVGSSQRLSRPQREKIWPVFEEFRSLLNEQGAKEYVDVLRDARLLIENKGIKRPYRSVIVDEAQDMSPEAFRLIRALVPPQDGRGRPDDLFIVGDAHQRIYRHRVVLSQCGIDVRGRSRKLRINYRTTAQIRRAAVTVLEGLPFDDLDGGQDDQKGYLSLLQGQAPEIRLFETFDQEAAFVIEHIQALEAAGADPNTVCLVGRTKEVLSRFEGRLKESGIQVRRIQANEPDDTRQRGLRTATMHRVKGLEFRHVLLVGADSQTVPLAWALKDAGDVRSRKEVELRERALLYVAMTRARESLLITASGTLSPYLAASHQE